MRFFYFRFHLEQTSGGGKRKSVCYTGHVFGANFSILFMLEVLEPIVVIIEGCVVV